MKGILETVMDRTESLNTLKKHLGNSISYLKLNSQLTCKYKSCHLQQRINGQPNDELLPFS